jgi:hypothetical protein
MGNVETHNELFVDSALDALEEAIVQAHKKGPRGIRELEPDLFHAVGEFQSEAFLADLDSVRRARTAALVHRALSLLAAS